MDELNESRLITLEQTLYLKGVAIFSILLGHLGFWNRGGGIGVNLFLLISGYGCYVSFSQKGLKNFLRENYTEYIYLTYWFHLLNFQRLN